MARRGGVLGGVLGFLVYLVIAEWIWVDGFGEHEVATGFLIAVLVGGGAFVGSRAYPRARGPRSHQNP